MRRTNGLGYAVVCHLGGLANLFFGEGGVGGHHCYGSVAERVRCKEALPHGMPCTCDYLLCQRVNYVTKRIDDDDRADLRPIGELHAS